jgi:hypothetical protein
VKFAEERSSLRRRQLAFSDNKSSLERRRRAKLAQRRMWLESLEDRSLLATLDLVVNLYEDNAGVPGALITTNTVTNGDNFFVEITAKDTSATPSGVIGLALDVGFNVTAFEEVDTPFNPDQVASPIITSKFPLFRGGTLDNATGTIDELRGASLPSLGQGEEIGKSTHERFGLLKFRADSTVASSPLTIAIGAGGVGFADGSPLTDVTIEAQTITVTPDTGGVPTLTIDDITANEGNGGGTTDFTFTVTLSPAATGTVTVVLETADGTAVAPGDYGAIAPEVVTFLPGETKMTRTVKVVADSIVEPTETFQVKLSKADGALIGDDTGIGTITNDDKIQASISPAVASPDPSSGTTNFDFTVTLDAPATQATVIPWTFAHVSTNDGDFDAGLTTSGKVTIPQGETSVKIPSFKVLGDNTVELDETFTVTLGTPETVDVELSAAKVGTGTVLNDDSATIIITGPADTQEGSAGKNNVVEFTVTLSNPIDVPVSVNFQTKDGTATTGDNDYQSTTGKITFPAGSTTAIKIPVNIVGDATVEPDETFSVLLDTLDAGTPARNVMLQTDTATAKILNDDAGATIVVQNATIVEGNSGTQTLKFSLALSAQVAGEVKVDVATQDATAKAGTDYTATNKTITFPANSTATVDFEVPISGDNVVELDETLTLVLSNLQDSGLGVTLPQGPITGTIQNDDTATITLAPASLTEGNAGTANMEFVATLSNPVDVDVTVDFATSDGTATIANNDYTETKQTLTFTAGGALTQKINVPIIGDTAAENNETFSATLTNVQAGGRNVTAGNAVNGTILDDDSVTANIADVSVVEGNSGQTDLVFTITLAKANDIADVLLQVSTADITATAGVDYVALTNQAVTISKGDKTATVTVKVIGETLIEKDETIKLSITQVDGAQIGDGEAIGTITNDDTAQASIDSISLNEGNAGTTDFDFTVTLTDAAQFDIVIPYTFAAGTTNKDDFGGTLPVSGKVTIPAQSKTAKIAIDVSGDTTLEANETFTITLGTPEDPAITLETGKGTGTGTIQNDDQVTVTISDKTDAEPTTGAKNFDFTVTLDQAAGIDVVVPWTLANATTTDADFAVGTAKTGKVTIPAGSTSAPISIPVAADAIDEVDETFTVTLGTPETAGAVLDANDKVGTGTIQDATVLPVASIADKSQVEGNSGTTNYDFTVTLDKAATVDVIIPWTFTHVTTADSDFGAGLTKTGKVTIPAGQTSVTISPPFPVNGDTTLEADETFTITLGTPEGGTATLDDAKDVGTGTILNDDGVTVSVTQTVSQNEGNAGTTNYDFTVSLDQAAGVDVVVPFTFAHVTTNDADFAVGFTKTGKVTIPAGQTSVKIPSFPALGDTTVEPNETFTVTLQTPETTGAKLDDAKDVGTGTLVNDDQLTVSINDLTQAEGNSGTTKYEFTVTLTEAAATDVVIPWTFAHVTTADNDFAAGLTKSGKVTVAKDSKTAKISFDVNGDTLVELDETFTVTLGTPETAGVVLSSTDNVGTGMVTNDDTATAKINSVTQNEGNSGTTKFDFTVTLDKAAAFDVVIPVTFANVTTVAGDFATAPTTTVNVTIPAGQTSKAVQSISVNGDTTVEANETFTLTLGTPDKTSVTLSATEKVGTGTITNDDAATISIADAKIIEPVTGTSEITFPITLSEVVDVDTTLTFTLTNGTTSDADFANLTKTGTVTIPAGSKTANLKFTVASDAIDEQDETFTVTLTNPTFPNAATRNVTIADGSATGTIQQDPDTGKLSGSVYVDTNNNGVRDANEIGVPGTVVTLTGTPNGGAAITLTAMTDDDGNYSFTNLSGGKYTITEAQPATMFDGIDVVGTQGGTLGNDVISEIVLDAGEEGTGNNFGELGLLPQFVTKRLFLASTPEWPTLLRVLGSRAAELAGNETLADQIIGGTIPSVVAANNTTAAANNNGDAAEFVPDDTSLSAGEAVDETPTPVVVATSMVSPRASTSAASTPARNRPTTAKSPAKISRSASTPKPSKAKPAPKAKPAAKAKPVAKVKSTASSTSASSQRQSRLQSLRTKPAAATPTTTPSSLELLALDDVLSREKKWR